MRQDERLKQANDLAMLKVVAYYYHSSQVDKTLTDNHDYDHLHNQSARSGGEAVLRQADMRLTDATSSRSHCPAAASRQTVFKEFHFSVPIHRQDKQVERKEGEDLLGGEPGLHIHIHKAIKFIARFIMTRDSNATLIKLYTAMCVCVCLV